MSGPKPAAWRRVRQANRRGVHGGRSCGELYRCLWREDVNPLTVAGELRGGGQAEQRRGFVWRNIPPIVVELFAGSDPTLFLLGGHWVPGGGKNHQRIQTPAPKVV